MSRGTPQVQVQLPTLLPWHRNLLVILFAAYVIELVLYNARVPIYDWLAWHGFSSGRFAPWQPVTRLLVQGASRGAVFGVLFGLLVLYFFLGPLEEMLDRRRLARAIGAGAVGGTLLPLAVDALGLLSGTGDTAFGWSFLVLALPALFGLARPDADVLLLVFPVKARVFLWGALVVALLILLVEQSLDSFGSLGVWLGVYGWWNLLGPGARRRDLKRQAQGIERELHRFQVLEGGRKGKSRPPDDETVH
jgi:hypothetical protein